MSTRAWKGFDWDAMERLHHKGYITDPVDKARSVVLTEVLVNLNSHIALMQLHLMSYGTTIYAMWQDRRCPQT